MNDQTKTKPLEPVPTVELVTQDLAPADIYDLCDATDAAIESGGGFGWLELPSRDILERFWKGVITMPSRLLFVSRLDGVICGTCQLIKPPANNEAQRLNVQLTTNFVAPWARGHGLASLLIEAAERTAIQEGFAVINLDVRETMETAMKLYETLGFEKIGTHPYYAKVDGKMLKGYYYTKLINEKAFGQNL